MPLTSGHLESLRRSVDPGVVARSRAYARAVRIVSADAVHVDATVRGTHEYEVFLTVEDHRLVASCTCPFFDDRFEPCKHVWAVVEAAVALGHLDALADVRRPRLVAGGPDDDLDDIYDDELEEPEEVDPADGRRALDSVIDPAARTDAAETGAVARRADQAAHGLSARRQPARALVATDHGVAAGA